MKDILTRASFAELTRKSALDFIRSGGIVVPDPGIRRTARFSGLTDHGDASLAMLQGDRTYSFDINLLLSDNAAAYTATGFSQVGGADAILDLGGNQGVTPTQQARLDAVVVIDITAIDVSSGNETYKIKVIGSNTAAFATATANLSGYELGKGTSLLPATQSDTIVGRLELLFTTERFNTKYEFIKLYNEIGGTTPSISYQAFAAVLPEP